MYLEQERILTHLGMNDAMNRRRGDNSPVALVSVLALVRDPKDAPVCNGYQVASCLRADTEWSPSPKLSHRRIEPRRAYALATADRHRHAISKLDIERQPELDLLFARAVRPAGQELLAEFVEKRIDQPVGPRVERQPDLRSGGDEPHPTNQPDLAGFVMLDVCESESHGWLAIERVGQHHDRIPIQKQNARRIGASSKPIRIIARQE